MTVIGSSLARGPTMCTATSAVDESSVIRTVSPCFLLFVDKVTSLWLVGFRFFKQKVSDKEKGSY